MRTFLGCACALVALAIAAAPASAAKPKLSVADVTVSEGAPSASLTVSASKKAAKAIAFRFETADGSAKAGGDYTTATSAARIKKRKRSATLAVPIGDDALDEPDEAFSLRLSSPRRAKLGDGVAEVKINDDDPAPTVSLSPTAVAEGTEGAFVRSVAVQLSAASAKPIEVDYATANGTGTAPGDFTATSGDLAFAPGDTAESFNLTTVGDYTDEDPDETMTVGFSNPINVSLPGSAQSLTITDDDPACVTADSPAAAVNLGPIAGDTGTPMLERVDQISPCVDTDWYRFTLSETSGSAVDLTAVITLDHVPNGSPSGGDLDVCARIGVAGSDVCSTNSGGASELIEICIDDPILGGADNTTEFFVEVDGFGNAVADYTLRMFGNVAVAVGGNLGNC
jgi:hypothetical protein